jgi:N4-gp56 family major capsid protein
MLLENKRFVFAYGDDQMGVVTTAGVGTPDPSSTHTGVKIDGALLDVYASEILRDSLPSLRFFQFAETLVELNGANAGDTLKIQKLGSIGIGKKLTENVPIETKSMNTSFKNITVDEWGDAVALSGRATYTSQIPLMEGAKLNLLDSYVITLDVDLRDTALSGTNIMFGYNDSATKTRATTRATMNENSVFNVALAEDINEFLSTNNTPKFGGANGYFVAIVHPHVIRKLRDDARWERVQNYNQTEAQFYGEVGRIANIRFVETTMMKNGVDTTSYIHDVALKDAVTDSVDVAKKYSVYQSVVFGRGYYAYVSSLPMELRDQTGDFGRTQEVAWYSLWGSDILENKYGVVVETI